MLSSVAENIYWMCRNIERAESIARVVSVNANLQLDLPRGLSPDWRPLIDVTGTNDQFEERYQEYTERQVVRYLLADTDSPSSVKNCLRNARESCRVVRDSLPREVWQYLTELQLFIDEHLQTGLTKKGRHAFTERIIRTCQMTNGLLASVMTRDIGYQFLRLGRNLERADMTTRFIDMRLKVPQLDRLPDASAVSVLQWVNVLSSMSAYQMYRRKMQAQVLQPQVLWFLLKDDEFPRSFFHCLIAIEESLGLLPDPQPCLLAVRKVFKVIERAKPESLKDDELNTLVDELQSGLIDIHRSMARMYFLPAAGHG